MHLFSILKSICHWNHYHQKMSSPFIHLFVTFLSGLFNNTFRRPLITLIMQTEQLKNQYYGLLTLHQAQRLRALSRKVPKHFYR
jgi:hypothetical protein